jgi:serine phosphatase RsbU (regulator of sigma subunit)
MLHRILPIIVALLVFVDAFLLLALWEVSFFAWLTHPNAIITSSIILIQLPLLYAIVYMAYIGPVQKLNQEIAKFMTGISEEASLSPNSLSKGMNDIISFFIKSLQILKVFKQEIREGRQLKSEVDIASEIQKHIFKKEETIVPSLEIALATTPSSEVGGDSFDIISGKSSNYYIYIGDVTGHGVPSGFVMMMVNALISAFALTETSGAPILAATNHILKPRIKQNMMMTAVMLRWDEMLQALYYTGAGHEYILVYRAKTNTIEKIKTKWVALGMVRDITKVIEEKRIPLDVGDVVILYTDGISEARYRSEQNGMLFGTDRIIDSIMHSGEKTAASIFQKLTIDLSAFMGYNHKQYDDITLIVARFVWPGQWATLNDIPDKIDSAHITEWNWWMVNNVSEKSL